MSRRVSDVMTTDVKTIETNCTVSQAVKTMNRNEIGCVVITNKGKPVGILTERDILKRVVYKGDVPAKMQVIKVMSKPLITVKPGTKIETAIKLMLKKNIKKLIVAKGVQLRGILSLTDLLPLLGSVDKIGRLALSKAPKHVRKAFQIYYDPIRQLRKTCPLTMSGGMAISCLGSKCMWYASDRCVFLNLIEKVAA
jgi:CBS domain-containing protein